MRSLALFIASLDVLSACTFVYNDALGREQCQVDGDCATDGAPGLVCIEHVCQVPTTPALRDCKQDKDCGDGERCGYDSLCYAKWGCIDAPLDWPAPSGPFNVRTLLRRVDNAGADVESVGEVDAVACLAEDPLCINPVVRSEQISLDANKELNIPFANVSRAGFVGMVKIQPRVAGAYLPTYLHATAATPWSAEYATAKDTFLSSSDTTALLQQFVGVQLDPTGVLVGFALYDCGGRPAAGVQVTPTSTPDATFIPVTAGNVPLVGGKATTDEGVGFMLDLPTNRLEVLVLRDQASQRVLASSVSFIVQGGGLNFFNFYPRYSAVQAWMKEYRRRSEN